MMGRSSRPPDPRAADTLLFGAGNQAAMDQACREAPFGKLTPEALYVHASALSRLSPLLRVYEGCGRALTGTVTETNIVKLNRTEPKVSYLAYPDFDRDPHPALATSIRADLRRPDIKYRDFRGHANPPILHRKKTFVPPDYPACDKFARLTTQEEKHGLLPTTIGMSNQWTALLADKGLRYHGHRLVRRLPQNLDRCALHSPTPPISRSRSPQLCYTGIYKNIQVIDAPTFQQDLQPPVAAHPSEAAFQVWPPE